MTTISNQSQSDLSLPGILYYILILGQGQVKIIKKILGQMILTMYRLEKKYGNK